MSNDNFTSAIKMQAVINDFAGEAKAARGKANSAEFMQYCLFLTGNISEKVKLRTKKSVAIKEALVEAGRSERNAQTVVGVVFNSKLGKLVKDCSEVQSVIDTLAEHELDSVTKLKQFVAGPVDKVQRLIDAIEKLEEGDRESLFAGCDGMGWLEEYK